MKKVFKLLVILGVLAGGAVGVYAWLQSRDTGAGEPGCGSTERNQ